MRSTDFIKDVNALAAKIDSAKTQSEIDDMAIDVEYAIYFAIADDVNPTLGAMSKLVKLAKKVDAANATVLEDIVTAADAAWSKVS